MAEKEKPVLSEEEIAKRKLISNRRIFFFLIGIIILLVGYLVFQIIKIFVK